MTYFVSNGM